MANGFRDPLAGINSFAPEFWRLVAESAPNSAKGPEMQPVASAPEAPNPYPPFTDPFAPDPEEPEELSPEDIKRQRWWDQLGEFPVYKGDPAKPELLPPAGEDESYTRPPRPPNEDATILRNITRLRERMARAQEFQRRGLGDPKLDSEIAEMRKQLERWEKALADRAEGAA